MAAPKTNGVLRTKLADMKVGDYIKWQYTDGATYSDMGDFSDTVSGTELPTFDTRADYFEKDPATGLQTIPTTKSGFFYFIKVDNGLLIADRAIKIISKQTLNQKNYLKGNRFRALNIYEWNKYIIYSDLNGAVTPGDRDTFHRDNASCETLQVGAVRVDNLKFYGPGNSDYDRNIADRPLKVFTGVSIDGNSFFVSTYAADSYRVLVYRPVMEYVDNSRSTNIYY